MSRVIYSNTLATDDQEALRRQHAVRLVTSDEEGMGVNALPGGVYGYTYSPGLPSAPLFEVRRYRSFEIHKLATGDVFIVGFATAENAARLASAAEEVTFPVQPEPEDGCGTLVKVPYSRIRQHRQYAAPNQHGFTVTIIPALTHA